MHHPYRDLRGFGFLVAVTLAALFASGAVGVIFNPPR